MGRLLVHDGDLSESMLLFLIVANTRAVSKRSEVIRLLTLKVTRRKDGERKRSKNSSHNVDVDVVLDLDVCVPDFLDVVSMLSIVEPIAAPRDRKFKVPLSLKC